MEHTLDLYGTRESLRTGWKNLVASDLLYKLLAFVVLTPVSSLLFRGLLLLLSGKSALSDVDIAYFFAGPLGWFCAIALGAVWLGILALEQASLLAILAASAKGKRLGVVSALRFAARNAPSVLRVTGRLIAVALLLVAPIVGVALAVYFSMLGQYDINFYLKERPNEFWIAVGIGVFLITLLAMAALRFVSSWFLALPLVLFDRVSPKSALGESNRLLNGHRLWVCLWISGWWAAGFAANTLATIVVGWVGWLLIPQSAHSLPLVAGQVGLMLLMLTIGGIALNVLSTIGFSLILFHAYRKRNPRANESIQNAGLSGAKTAGDFPAITKWRVAAATVIGVLVAGVVGFVAIDSLQLEDHTLVMAHRGASKAAPENSLAAVRGAIDAKADWVEIDVQETADGEVVVIHDSDFMRLANRPLKIWDATMPELRDLDIGSSFDARFASERTPTLDQVLEICKDRIGVLIELKYYGRDKMLEQRVADIVDRHAMNDQVMAMSLKPEGVRKMKALRPNWKCGVLLSVSVGNLGRIEADFLAINGKFASRSLVSKAHRAGKPVYVWTIDDPATMSLMMNRGVDGIITNRPEVSRDVLSQRAKLSSTERLLMEIAVMLGAKPQVGEQ